jgi:phosphoribosylformylglycinamidine synthase PurS subunit
MLRAEIRIELKKGVADPEGKNVKKTLELLGFGGIRAVKTVKVFIIEMETDDREEYKVLRKELALLRLFGIIERRDGRLRVTERGMYPMSVAMREFFSCLNSLRELCIENQI